MDPRYKSPTANVDRDESEDFRDLEQFTGVLKWMLWAGAVLALASVVSSWMQMSLLSRGYSPAEAQANDLREGAVAGLSGLLMLATFVVFGRWIVLAHRNLPGLGATHVEFTPGWALGWFFIPIVNIWKPFQAMRFLWQGSHDVRRPDAQDVTWILPTWWALWLITQFVSNASFQVSRVHSLDAAQTSTGLAIAASVVYVPLHLIAALMVTRVWHAQRKQHENPGEFAPAAGFADAGS